MILRTAINAKHAEKSERRQRVTEKIRVTLKVNATPLIAQRSCAPTAAPVGAQLRWAMGVEREVPLAPFAVFALFALKDLATAALR
jgi:hypothetical protein